MNSFYKDGLRFECTGSGKCCTSRGSYGYVYLTLDDRRRMARHLGLSTALFTRRYCQKTEGYFHLKEVGNDCRFLSEKRCDVYEARPEQCRTWPFWPENMNARTWTKEVAAFCPGVGRGRLHTSEEIEKVLKSQRA